MRETRDKRGMTGGCGGQSTVVPLGAECGLSNVFFPNSLEICARLKDLGDAVTACGTRITRMNANDANQSPASSRPVMVEKELSHAIVGCFFEVYNELGYGFVESLYTRALEIAMRGRGLQVHREYPIIVTFGGQQIGFHRIDMLVERRVIVEVKSTERLAESARRQLRSYVTGLGLHLGMLLHFGPVPRFHRELGGRRAARGSRDSGDSR